MSKLNYFSEKPEYIGSGPIRQEIEVIPADNPNDKTIGFTMREITGFAIYNLKKHYYIYY